MTGYNEIVKTAVSIPDELFDAADQAAAERKLNRSEFYALALRQLLADDDTVTARLDEVYSRTATDADDEAFRRRAAARLAEDVQW